MPEPCCAFLKPNGEPCHARPLPERPFCLFHDPGHQPALAEGRSKGGAAPRRRIRRFPLVLDHLHVAQLLSELFVEALNHPEALDPKRLQALTNLARMLLKAVGVPPSANGCFKHRDRSQPPATQEHLLRIYRPLSEEEEALLAAEPEPADTETPDPHDALRDTECARTPERLHAAPPDPPRWLDPMEAALEAWQASMAAAREASLATAPQPAEQGVDRSRTGPPATDPFSDRRPSTQAPASGPSPCRSLAATPPVTRADSIADDEPAADDPEPPPAVRPDSGSPSVAPGPPVPPDPERPPRPILAGGYRAVAMAGDPRPRFRPFG